MLNFSAENCQIYIFYCVSGVNANRHYVSNNNNKILLIILYFMHCAGAYYYFTKEERGTDYFHTKLFKHVYVKMKKRVLKVVLELRHRLDQLCKGN